jgi:hypothetical protein
MRIITKKKKITVATGGRLMVKGGINGPIEIPYYEEVGVIGQMLMHRYTVYEHLADGTKVLLTVHNYDKENGDGDMKIRSEAVKSASELNASAKIAKNTTSAAPVIDLYMPR